MRENPILIVAIVFILLSLLSTIFYFTQIQNSFLFQISALIIAMICSFTTVFSLIVLFSKRKQFLTSFEYTSGIIITVLAIFVFVLCSILLSQCIILQQAVWYTLPTMLLYESGCDLYSDPEVLVNDVQPTRKSFQKYQESVFQEVNGNLDIFQKRVILNFAYTNHIQLGLPQSLYEKYFNLQIVALDGTTLFTLTNVNQQNTVDLYGPTITNQEGISVTSIVAYLFLNIRIYPFSKATYDEIQAIIRQIQISTTSPHEGQGSLLLYLYPNVLEDKNFRIRDSPNFPSLEYFQGFCNIKPLQIKNHSVFWSKFSSIGIDNGQFEKTFYYRLAPLLNTTRIFLQKKMRENRRKKGWFSFSDFSKSDNNSLGNLISKTILYWFYKFPIPNNNFVFLTSTDANGNSLNGEKFKYQFTFPNDISFYPGGFWSFTVYKSASKKIKRGKSHYTSSFPDSIVLGNLEGDLFIPNGPFYIILKLFNVSTGMITSKSVPQLSILENYCKKKKSLTVLGKGSMPKRFNLFVVYFINCLVNKNYLEWLKNQLSYITRQIQENEIPRLRKYQVHLVAVIEQHMENHFRIQTMQLFPGIDFNFYFSHTEDFEYPGIKKVWELGQQHPGKNDIILYFHSKGVTREKNYSPRYDNRDYMLTLKNVKRVLRIFAQNEHIEKIGALCGGIGWIWYNFWYARGSYLVKVERPIKTKRRHYYEDWLGRKLKEGSDMFPKEERPYSFYENSLSSCYSLAYKHPIGYKFDPLGGFSKIE